MTVSDYFMKFDFAHALPTKEAVPTVAVLRQARTSPNYIGTYPICRDEEDFSRWRPIWKFSNAIYLFYLTSYGLVTGLADFFTERCYWYLQSALNPCLKAAPLLVKKPDFPNFLLFLLSFIFLL